MTKQQKKEARRKFRLALQEREHGGKDLRAKIQATSDRERFEAWESKRSYGRDTRWILLAYGLVKGVPYKAIEGKTAEDNYPSVNAIQWGAQEGAGIALSYDDITTWLEAEAVVSAVEEVVTAPPAPRPQPVPVEPKKGFFARLFSAAKGAA